MVQDARAASGPGAVRPLNAPRPLRVETRDGSPCVVVLRGRRVGVASVEDRWRIDDEWWRDHPVARAYAEVLLDDGRRLTLFHDEVGDAWYEQRYGG